MNNCVNISMVLTPHMGDKLNLNLLIAQIKSNKKFICKEIIEDFLIEFYYKETSAKILLYHDGMVHYNESVSNKEFSPKKMNTILKNCFSLLKYFNINTKYEKKLGVYIEGEDPKITYEQLSHEFGYYLFEAPSFRDMEFGEISTKYSIFIEEKSNLIFKF